ncbi:MAG TPA: hypothetical protein VIF09_18425 [Polyangiaceae bacterium]|jgi:hypothetical protein
MSAAIAVARPDVVQCARCGHASSVDSWSARPTERTLTGADLSSCVVAWPEDAVVEVRGCPGCGASIARRRRGAR